jgi:hypothetical protein
MKQKTGRPRLFLPKSVICDKTRPQKNLVRSIAQWARVSISDIDYATIPVTLPYVRLTKKHSGGTFRFGKNLPLSFGVRP